MPDSPDKSGSLTERSRFSPRLILLVAVLTGLFTLIGILSIDVRSRLQALKQADSDNGQWVVMQTEVEVLRLRYAIRAALNAPGGVAELGEVRRWFDVLYSRVQILGESPLYASFTEMPENRARIDRMSALLGAWTPAIDGTDSALGAILPAMQVGGIELNEVARGLSLSALREFSQSTDNTRSRISDTLIRLAFTTAFTILLLGFLIVLLLRLYRLTRRQAEENSSTGARLRMIIAHTPDAVIVTNRGGWTVEFNPAAEAMFGYTRDEVIGHQIVPMIFDRGRIDDYQALIAEAVASAYEKGPQRFELEARRADGSTFPVEISIGVSRHGHGAVIVGFIRDVSARKAADRVLEEALSKARSGEKAKAEFLTVMSHEMRTPLNGLLGSLDLLRDTPLNEDQRKLLAVMEASGDILLGHVNSVLDIARAEAGEIKIADTAFDLDQLIEDCIANQRGLARRANSTLSHRPLTGPFGEVRGDPVRLRQILLNLIGNAVKFTHAGTITLESERLEPRAVSGRPGMVEFRVIDTGIGIAPEDQDRIFEDFETVDAGYARQNGGTGLGLGIVRRLVNAMGGEIGVESEPGEGSVFWLRLPLRPAHVLLDDAALGTASGSAAVRGAARAGSRSIGPSRDILVIEDNEINRLLLRRFLEEAGHRVSEAVDGLNGVALASEKAFDVILTDVSMPRMDGIEATRRIRADKGPSASSRIIALTAHALPDEIARFRAAGMDDCLTKPVARDILLARIEGPPPVSMPSATGPSSGVETLDPAPLDDLARALGPEMLRSLVGRLTVEAETTVSTLSSTPHQTDATLRLAHRLAGSCSTFGATAMRRALWRIEQAHGSGDAARVQAEAKRLPELWGATRIALEAYVNERAI